MDGFFNFLKMEKNFCIQYIIFMETTNFDFCISDEAAEIDLGIRETIKGIRLSILAMGIGIARLKGKSLYRDLGFRSMTGYIENLCIENKMERSTMLNYVSMGEVYLKYRSELEQIGFSEADGPTKLIYMDRALVKNSKNDVLENIKNMSVREFKAFSRNNQDNAHTVSDLNDKTVTRISAIGKKMTINGNNVYIDSKQAITLNSALGKRTSRYLKKVLMAAGKALEEGGVILPFVLHDMDEVRRFRPAANRMLGRMRQRQKAG